MNRGFNLILCASIISMLSNSPRGLSAQEAAVVGERQIIQTQRDIFTTRSNPITLPLAAETDAFQFAIYGDRTGGDPSGLKFLREAVQDTNLMAPDFVMTVGDLIQGYNRPQEWLQQAAEFKGIMDALKMEWFPVAGNHDIYWDFRDPRRPTGHHEANFEKHFGPLWYSFTHKNHGFIVLYSDEGDGTGDKGFRQSRLQNVSQAQLDFLKQALERLSSSKRTFVFLHHPRWLGGGYDGSNWPAVHQMLVDAGNVSAVFAGHIHHMTYQGPIDGIEYFTLATTGGHLAVESPELGYLHHFNMVTVRDEGIAVAAIPVGSVIDPRTFDSEFLADVERVRSVRPKRSGPKLTLQPDGTVAENYSMRIRNPGQFPIEVTITPPVQGQWKSLPDHQHVIVPPGKTEGLSFFVHRQAPDQNPWQGFVVPQFSMSVDYLHTTARIRLPEVRFATELTLAETTIKRTADRCLNLRGRQSQNQRREANTFPNDSVRISAGDAVLAQGAFTVEAWVNPADVSQSRAIVAKTQSSEFALFLHDGFPNFDVHLNGRYVSPRAETKLPLNKWSHVAGVYDGADVHLFVDGKQVQTLPGQGQRTTNNLPLYIGADPDGAGNPTREFAGKIDEVRLSVGTRYSQNFKPQSRFESDDSTRLLLHFDRSFGPFFPDASGNQATAIGLGQAKISNKN